MDGDHSLLVMSRLHDMGVFVNSPALTIVDYPQIKKKPSRIYCTFVELASPLPTNKVVSLALISQKISPLPTIPWQPGE